MIDDTKTRQALIEAAIDFITNNDTLDAGQFGIVTGLPTSPIENIAFENQKFDTIDKDPWFSVFYLANTPDKRAIGACGIDVISGFIQIDVNVPEGTGEAVHMEWERKARIYFAAGKAFTYQSHNVLVTSSGMGQGRQVENYFRKSLTVAFRADLRSVRN